MDQQEDQCQQNNNDGKQNAVDNDVAVNSNAVLGNTVIGNAVIGNAAIKTSQTARPGPILVRTVGERANLLSTKQRGKRWGDEQFAMGLGDVHAQSLYGECKGVNINH